MAIQSAILSRSPAFRQLGALAGVAAVIGVALLFWGREPTFGVLYSGLGKSDVAAVVAQLQKQDVDYRLDDVAGTIFVPADQLQVLRLQLADAGLPRSGGIDRGQTQEPGNGSAANDRARQDLEQELAATIADVSGVQSARVHLADVERGLSDASASVMVKLFPGRVLEQEQIAAITHLVASGIPNLEPQRVTVVDHKGRLLSIEKPDPAVAESKERIEHTRLLEQAYASRIKAMLTPVLGDDRVRVQVWLDMDYGTEEPATDGRAGNNAQPPAPERAGESTGVANGKVKRLSVVVAVNDPSTLLADANLAREPRSSAEIALIAKLVKNAVGYDAQRGDTVNVVSMPNAQSPGLASLPETTSWDVWPRDFLKEMALWIMAAAVVLFALRAAIRHFGMSRAAGNARPDAIEFAEENLFVEDDASAIQLPEQTFEATLEQARATALQDARRSAQVMRRWLVEDKHSMAVTAQPRNSLSGAERAAVFLMSLDETGAVEIMRHLDPGEVQKIGEAMVGTRNVTKPQVNGVLRNFADDLGVQTGLGVGSQDYLRRVVTHALGEDTAASLMDRILLGRSSRGLGALKWMDPRTIAEIIRVEHPQIIAIVLSYLEADQAAEVVAALPETIRPGVLMRVASLDGVQTSALAVLDDVLDKQFATGAGCVKASGVGGKKIAANILKFMDGAQEARILDKVRDSEPGLAQSIEDLMFAFENLADLDDRSMQALLREVSSEGLVTALKGGDDAVKAKVFRNMSKRAAEMLYDDLEARGPVRTFEIQAAQKEILAIVRSMAEAGNLSLARSCDEQVS